MGYGSITNLGIPQRQLPDARLRHGLSRRARSVKPTPARTVHADPWHLKGSRDLSRKSMELSFERIKIMFETSVFGGYGAGFWGLNYGILNL